MPNKLDLFYHALLREAANERRRASVEAVYRAIQRHLLNGDPISVAAVARTAANFPGGPKEQSIRNDSSGLKALVEIASTECAQALPGRKRRARKDDWIERISDPLIRSGCRGLHDRVVLYQKENDRLRAALARLEPLGDIREIDGGGGAHRQGPRFSKEEAKAVSSFLASLADEGFLIEPSGELVARSGRSVAAPGLITALRKIQFSTDQSA